MSPAERTLYDEIDLLQERCRVLDAALIEEQAINERHYRDLYNRAGGASVGWTPRPGAAHPVVDDPAGGK